ncbi:MAG: fimbrillin family protein [Tannerellaceae bacterium]|nr:fimbrillin family protein [Tannerellaceae bacterium]
MKKLVFRLIMGAGILASFTACNEDKNSGEKEVDKTPEPVVIHTTVDTKAYDTTWEYGDEIGVTMYDVNYENILEDQFNYEYITELNLSIFHSVDLDETLYFPLDGSDMRLKAYYPYIAGLPQNMIIHWRVDDQSSLQDIDLMTAEHVSGFNKEVTLVRLHFYHRLCKLVFLLLTEDETAEVNLADCDMVITGMETGIDYDLFNDEFVGNPDGIANISVPLRTDENANQRQAIVLPREMGEGVTFQFTTPEGETYTARMSDTLTLEGGNRYTFIITLAENPTLVTATIEPWIDNDYEYIIAN